MEKTMNHQHPSHHGPQPQGAHGPSRHPAQRPAAGHHGSHSADYQRRFWVALVLTLPLVILSEMVQDWFGYSTPSFTGQRLVGPVLGSAVLFYGGWPFLVGAFHELHRRRPGMMILISLAVTVAYGASLFSELTDGDLEFWWELATLVTIMLFGHWQEMRALGQARSALTALSELIPDEAERVTSAGIERIPASELLEGDIVLVRPGARIPADGTIVDGSADLDESVLSGESRPVARQPGDRVVAGAVVAGSALRIRVVATGEATALAGIRRMVAEAQESRSRAQVLADRAAALLFYLAVVAGLVTFAVWSALGDPGEGVVRTIAVLVIACPHALGLAIPLVVSIATGRSANSGILIKDRMAFERVRTIDTVLFDKTGTLTRASHQLTAIAAVDGDEAALLRLAAAVEQDSEHPLARAIVAAASERGSIPRASEFKAIAGRGVEGTVDGSNVSVGGPALLRALQANVPPDLDQVVAGWKSRGAAVLYVLRDGALIGALALEDTVREESFEAVRGLRAEGIRVAMITGDARQVAEAVAAQLGIEEVFAEVLPEDKDKAVADLQARGRSVAMVGDGVNDAPALARADAGIAIGAGTDVAIASAGIVLASDDPRAVLRTVRLARASYRKMLQNLTWAAGYNIVALPLAAGALANWGFVLPPAVGALLMSSSTVIVALNAQLLRRAEL